MPAPGRARPGLEAALRAFEDYLRVERGLAPSSIVSYRRDLRRYAEHLRRAKIGSPDAIAPRHVADALGERATQGVSAATLNRMLAAVRHFHRFCVREGLAKANPAALIDGPARGLSLPKALRADECVRIVEAADGNTPSGLRDRAMLELLYGAGLRVAELVALDVEDVDTGQRLVRALGKGSKERVVPFGRPAAEALDRYVRTGRPELIRAGRPSGALFLNARGSRLSRQSAWKVVKRYAARVYPDTRVFPHALRHSFATHLVARGADIRVVQETLGHARLSTTQVYTLVTREKLKDVVETAHPRGRRASGDGTHGGPTS